MGRGLLLQYLLLMRKGEIFPKSSRRSLLRWYRTTTEVAITLPGRITEYTEDMRFLGLCSGKKQVK